MSIREHIEAARKAAEMNLILALEHDQVSKQTIGEALKAYEVAAVHLRAALNELEAKGS